MGVFPLTSTHYAQASPFSASTVAGKRHPITGSRLTLSLKPPTSDSDKPTTSSSSSGDLRRPNTHKPLRTSPSKTEPSNPKISKNPIKNLVSPSSTHNTNLQNLTNKLWLTSKLSPPPPPPPPPLPPEEEAHGEYSEIREFKNSSENEPSRIEFRQEGKIFVGNIPSWIKKHELAEFFRQFGPIKNVILIKGHNDTERNIGFGFVIYDGPTAEKAAMKAVEFDGVEFHGRVLTVKLDDGRRVRERLVERARWVEGADGVDYKSKWHEEREGSRSEFRKTLETQPKNWRAVIRAFQRIKKVLLLDNLLVSVSCIVFNSDCGV